MTNSPDPLDRLDAGVQELAIVQAQILEIVATSMAAHTKVDAEYAPQLNPLYRRAQEIFDENKSIAEAHSAEILSKGRKSSKRSSGTVGWRLHAVIVQHVNTEELIRRIKAKGQSVSRKLLRRTVTWSLRMENLKSETNNDIVSSIDGVEIQRKDEFFISPNNGLRMSTAHPYWPTLDGLTGSQALAHLIKDEVN